jgi:predicted aspartyl protease
MAFDTGTDHTSISRLTAIRLGFDPDASPDQLSIATAGGVTTVPVITLPRLRALEYEQTNLRVACPNIPATTGVEGILGGDFFRRFHIFINYQKGWLVVREARDVTSRLRFGFEVLRSL